MRDRRLAELGGKTETSLSDYQESLPVRLIATPRADFMTCQTDEQVSNVVDRNRHYGFDFVPVQSANSRGGGSIVGVLCIAEVESCVGQVGAVSEHIQPLSEEHLIGADASILTYVRDADRNPFRLMISGRMIQGLVNISDLQRLPVRAALFAMVTHLEMEMTATIRDRLPEITDWMKLLSDGRAKKVAEEMERAKSMDTFVEPVLYTQFCDKVKIICKMGGFGNTNSWNRQRFETDMKDTEKLRDNLAHANQYAATREAAHDLCRLVRTMDDWIGAFANSTFTEAQTDC